MIPSGPQLRMLNRCSIEWLSIALLIDREQGQSITEALAVLSILVDRKLVKVRSGDVDSGPEFKISDGGILAVMAGGPVLEESA